MSKVVETVVGVALTAVGVVTGQAWLVVAGLSIVSSALLPPSLGGEQERQASETQLQIGEVPRQALFGRAATAGSLMDAFNFGGEYGTDWEVLIIALADHECDALEYVYVKDDKVTFTGNGPVAGYNGQLELHWLPGTATQTMPSIVTSNSDWSANDNAAGISVLVAAYKADEPDSENPVWAGGRPSFLAVLRGKKCYIPSRDSTVAGGSGPHRWNNPSTWQWTNNAEESRYQFQRGIYALDRVDQPDQLLIGRGLSEVEAPPERSIAHAATCAEQVALDGGGTEDRYTFNGLIGADEDFLKVEGYFAEAMGGIITQPEGGIEVEPGAPKAVVLEITDADILNLKDVNLEYFRGESDQQWVNTVAPRYVEEEERWRVHSAPVRRVVADIVEDRGLRLIQPTLKHVTSGTQAQRIGEIKRRLGRLLATGSIVLGPRFAALEEGDWIGWTSNRYFKGARRVFRIESYRRNEGWRITLPLREINASVYLWTPAGDERPDQSDATDQAEPAAIPAPAADWAANGTTISSGDGSGPAIIVTGSVEAPFVQAVRVEFRPDGQSVWRQHADFRGAFSQTTITAVGNNQAYEVSVRYIVSGQLGPRRVLGPVTTGTLSLAKLDGIEAGATRIVIRDTYVDTETYVRGDWVERNGSNYVLIVNQSTGFPPPDFTRWKLAASAGSGPPGANGEPGLTLYLDNPSDNIPTEADGSGGDYSDAGGFFIVARAGTPLNPTFSVLDQNPNTGWATIDPVTGEYTPVDPGVTKATAVFRAVVGGVPYDLQYRLTKGLRGVEGPNLKLVSDLAGFTFVDGQADPASQSITLTAQLTNLTGNATFTTTPNVTLGGSGNTRTLSLANFGSNRQVSVQIELDGIVDIVTIVRFDRELSATAGGNLVSNPIGLQGLDGWVNGHSLSTDLPPGNWPEGARSIVFNDVHRQASARPGLAVGALVKAFGWLSTLGHTGGSVGARIRNGDGVIYGQTLRRGQDTLPADTDWTFLEFVAEITTLPSGSEQSFTPAFDIVSSGGGDRPKQFGWDYTIIPANQLADIDPLKVVQFEAEITNAQADATAATNDLIAIASNGIVAPDEKISLRERRANIMREYPIWLARAQSFGISQAIIDNFTLAYLAHTDFLTDDVLIDVELSTPVVRADLLGGHTDYVEWRAKVIEAVSVAASQQAEWDLITGSNKAENKATNTPAGDTNLVRYSLGEGDRGWQLLNQADDGSGAYIDLFGQRFLGNVYDNTAVNQEGVVRSLYFPIIEDQRYSFSTQMEARGEGGDPDPDLWQFRVEYADQNQTLILQQEIDAGTGAQQRFQRLADFDTPPSGARFARFVGRLRSSAAGTVRLTLLYPMASPATAGQTIHPAFVPGPNADDGADETLAQPVVGLLDPSSGRSIDARFVHTAGSIGPRSVTDVTPSYTVGGSNVTVNLPSHTRKIPGVSGPITLNYGAASFTHPFSTPWYAYVDDAGLVGQSSPAVGITQNADQLLFAGRYHIASGVTPDSGGSGGSAGGGGGTGGGVPDDNPGGGGSIP